PLKAEPVSSWETGSLCLTWPGDQDPGDWEPKARATPHATSTSTPPAIMMRAVIPGGVLRNSPMDSLFFIKTPKKRPASASAINKATTSDGVGIFVIPNAHSKRSTPAMPPATREGTLDALT